MSSGGPWWCRWPRCDPVKSTSLRTKHWYLLPGGTGGCRHLRARATGSEGTGGSRPVYCWRRVAVRLVTEHCLCFLGHRIEGCPLDAISRKQCNADQRHRANIPKALTRPLYGECEVQTHTHTHTHTHTQQLPVESSLLCLWPCQCRSVGFSFWPSTRGQCIPVHL